MRRSDWAGAERLASEYFDKAESAYEAACYVQARATALAALGRTTESLDANRLAEQLVPVEPHFKIVLARRLSTECGQPEAALAKLAEAERLLEPDQRRGLLGEQGLALLALNREAEAVECFRELTRPERLARMRTWDYIGVVDFRLVTHLVARGLVPDLCVAYLEAAAVIAGGHNPDHVDGIRNLIRLARNPGTRPAPGEPFPDQRPPLFDLP